MLYIPEPNLCFFTIYTFSNLGDFAILWFSMCRLHNLTVFRWCNSAIRRFGKCMTWQFADVGCGGFVILHYCDFHMFSFCEFVILWFTDIPIIATLQFCEVKISPLYVLVTSMFLGLSEIALFRLGELFFNYAILRFSDYSIWDCKRGD